MWQKDQTLLTKIGVFFLLIYTLIIQHPRTGVSLDFPTVTATTISNDLSANDIFSYDQGKMKLVEEKPLSKPVVEKRESMPKVASISIPKQTQNPTPTPEPSPEPTIQPTQEVKSVSVEVETQAVASEIDVIEIIKSAANEYNVDSSMMISIARCESGFRANAVNGQYAGIFQFHPSTWQSNRRAMGLDDSTSLRFNVSEAAKTAAFKMSRDGFGAWPECSNKALIAINE